MRRPLTNDEEKVLRAGPLFAHMGSHVGYPVHRRSIPTRTLKGWRPRLNNANTWGIQVWEWHRVHIVFTYLPPLE